MVHQMELWLLQSEEGWATDLTLKTITNQQVHKTNRVIAAKKAIRNRNKKSKLVITYYKRLLLCLLFAHSELDRWVSRHNELVSNYCGRSAQAHERKASEADDTEPMTDIFIVGT